MNEDKYKGIKKTAQAMIRNLVVDMDDEEKEKFSISKYLHIIKITAIHTYIHTYIGIDLECDRNVIGM